MVELTCVTILSTRRGLTLVLLVLEQVCYNLAAVLEATGEFDEAMVAFERAQKLGIERAQINIRNVRYSSLWIRPQTLTYYRSFFFPFERVARRQNLGEETRGGRKGAREEVECQTYIDKMSICLSLWF